MHQRALDPSEGGVDSHFKAPPGAILEKREPAGPPFNGANAGNSSSDPPRRKGLVANAAWMLGGNLIYAACQWGMVVLLAKAGNPHMVGQFSLGLAVTAPVFMFLNLQLRSVQATDSSRDYAFGDYLGLRLLTTLLALLVIAGLGFFTGHDGETALVILAVGLAKAVESISDVFYGLQQQQERMDRISWSLLLRGGLALPALGVCLFLMRSVVWATLGLALAWALVLVAYDIPQSIALLQAHRGNLATPTAEFSRREGLRPSWAPKTLFRLAWLALPLGLVMMLISLTANIPRYFIEGTGGQSELGIFAALAYLVVAGTMVMSAIGQAASPRLASYYAAGDGTGFRTLQLKLVGLGALAGFLGVLLSLVLGEKLLTVLYTPEYAQQTRVLFWLMVSGGIGYIASFLGFGMTAARYFHVQAPLFAGVALVTTAGCALLIPEHGLVGAALATVIAAGAQLIGSALIVLTALRKLRKVSEP